MNELTFEETQVAAEGLLPPKKKQIFGLPPAFLLGASIAGVIFVGGLVYVMKPRAPTQRGWAPAASNVAMQPAVSPQPAPVAPRVQVIPPSPPASLQPAPSLVNPVVSAPVQVAAGITQTTTPIIGTPQPQPITSASMATTTPQPLPVIAGAGSPIRNQTMAQPVPVPDPFAGAPAWASTLKAQLDSMSIAVKTIDHTLDDQHRELARLSAAIDTLLPKHKKVAEKIRNRVRVARRGRINHSVRVEQRRIDPPKIIDPPATASIDPAAVTPAVPAANDPAPASSSFPQTATVASAARGVAGWRLLGVTNGAAALLAPDGEVRVVKPGDMVGGYAVTRIDFQGVTTTAGAIK